MQWSRRLIARLISARLIRFRLVVTTCILIAAGSAQRARILFFVWDLRAPSAVPIQQTQTALRTGPSMSIRQALP